MNDIKSQLRLIFLFWNELVHNHLGSGRHHHLMKKKNKMATTLEIGRLTIELLGIEFELIEKSEEIKIFSKDITLTFSLPNFVLYFLLLQKIVS